MAKEHVSEDQIKKLVIARLETMPPHHELAIGAEGTFSREQLIEEVKKGSGVGRTVIDIELEFLRAFKKGALA